MTDLSEREKLRRLIPHWIEHNRSHAMEFSRWSERARACGEARAAELIESAAGLLRQAETDLAAALEQIGGAAGSPCHNGGHRHDA